MFNYIYKKRTYESTKVKVNIFHKNKHFSKDFQRKDIEKENYIQ